MKIMEYNVVVFIKGERKSMTQEITNMKTVQVQLPDVVVTELSGLVKSGWFTDENEIVRLALLEFVRRYRFALIEQFQREDIAWALQQKRAKV